MDPQAQRPESFVVMVRSGKHESGRRERRGEDNAPYHLNRDRHGASKPAWKADRISLPIASDNTAQQTTASAARRQAPHSPG